MATLLAAGSPDSYPYMLPYDDLVGTWNVRSFRHVDDTCARTATPQITSSVWLVSTDPGAVDPMRKVVVAIQGDAEFPTLAGNIGEGQLWLSGYADRSFWGEAGWSFDLVPRSWTELNYKLLDGKHTLSGVRYVARIERMQPRDYEGDVRLVACVDLIELEAVKQ
ncbi:hypothetical protein L6R53_14095 [Myxococcota bacterium]|nr:hypothetical protein [Myxococcota bacterium]